MTNKCYQDTGETPAYKSKTEVQIARLLDREKVPFAYEHPLAVIDRERTRIWYPDFYLSGYGMVIEYFGMNYDPGYRKWAEHKIQVYRQNGIDGVFLSEDSFKGDWPPRILGQIEDLLQKRIHRFCARHGREDTGWSPAEGSGARQRQLFLPLDNHLG
jgi:hypothetical protein